MAINNYLVSREYPDGDGNEMNLKAKRRIRDSAKKYVTHNGVLYKKEEDGSTGVEILNTGNIHEVVEKMHDEGHFGVLNTWRRIRVQYDAPGLYDFVKNYVTTCGICQKRAKRQHKKTVKSNPIPTPSTPFFMIGCDAVGPVMESKKGNRNLLVAVDFLTRWPVVAAVPDITAETVTWFLFHCVVKDFGVPSYILTDRGSNFLSDHVAFFLKRMGCRHLTTTAYRPQTNGLCERMNQTVVQALSKIIMTREDYENWDDCLDEAVLAVRTMPNEATKFTPAMLLYGYEMRTPGNWPAPRVDYVEGEIVREVESRIRVITNMVQEHRAEAKERSGLMQQRRKKKYDEAVIPRSYQLGDEVLYRDKVKENKFASNWIGPFTVVRVNVHGTYWLDGPGGKKVMGAVNGDELKPWQDRERMKPDVTAVEAHQQYRRFWDIRREI
ncbi:hypothetical protein G6F43_012963 [Rhizopus delemar]|nr:hypothetical protein G6F43_012963 [Rhizopus delemar]